MIKDSKDKYYQAVGRRKTAVAQVRLTPASKATFTINDKTLPAYFVTEQLRSVVKRPLATAKLDDKFSVSARLNGGGTQAQASALAHALARALVVYRPNLKPSLKNAKLMKRDPRMKERRKFGLKKARKAPQWSKR